MRIIIAGSRTIEVDYDHMLDLLWEVDLYFMGKVKFTEVVCGEAKGVDKSGRLFAEEHGLTVKSFPADWDKYGKGAGHIRNKQMADYSDALLLIWDGSSKGSANMKATMLKLNKPVYEVIIGDTNEI
jgi:hypothetical protein